MRTLYPNLDPLGQRFSIAGTRPGEIFLKFTHFNMSMTKIIEFIQ